MGDFPLREKNVRMAPSGAPWGGRGQRTWENARFVKRHLRSGVFSTLRGPSIFPTLDELRKCSL
jgi:hypothetical protein